jgi:hypothetical protein
MEFKNMGMDVMDLRRKHRKTIINPKLWVSNNMWQLVREG